MTAAAYPVALLPPPELAPALAALLDGHGEKGGDPAAWAAVRDILEESGRDPVVGGPEVEAFWDGVRWQPSYGAKPPLDWTTVSLSSGAVLKCLTDVDCTLAEWRAHGPALARWHPLLRVSLTDREPQAGAGGFLWAGVEHPVFPEPCRIGGLLAFLPRAGNVLARPGKSAMMYGVREAADAALSKGAILWARAQP